jgi:hypothetical protein
VGREPERASEVSVFLPLPPKLFEIVAKNWVIVLNPRFPTLNGKNNQDWFKRFKIT